MSRAVGARTVLLNVHTGTYLSLTGSGARLWQLYEERGEGAAIAAASAEYDVPEERIRADLGFLRAEVQSLRARRERFALRPVGLPSPSRLVAVPFRGWRALLQTVIVAGVVEVGMRLLPLPQITRFVGMRLSFDRPGDEARPTAVVPNALSADDQLRVWATDRVFARWPFGDTCLRRALVLGFHMRRDAPSLRIGVREQAYETGATETAAGTATIAAHAWVETARATLLALPGYEGFAFGPAPGAATFR